MWERIRRQTKLLSTLWCEVELAKRRSPQQAPAARPAQQQAPRPQRQAAPQPRPKIRQVDDDAPIYGQTTVRRKRKAPNYALPIKILMISFSGLVGLFSLVLLLTFLGDFLNIKGGGLGESGYSLAFDFDHSTQYLSYGHNIGWIGLFIAFLIILTLIGFSVPRILNDIKFFKAKEFTVRVERRRRKAILWLILFPSLLLVAIILILCTKPIAGVDKTNAVLGGGAIATVVFMFFMLAFVIAEEVLVLITLRLTPKEQPYEEYQEYYEEEQ